MFEIREDYSDMVGSLFGLFSGLKRGDIVDHQSIVEILGVQPHQDHWQLCMGKLKRRMEQERQTSIWPEHGIGYKLCTIQEQLELAHIRQVRARRQLRRGIRSVEALPQTGLTMKQRELRAIQTEALRKSHRELTGQIHAKLPTQQATPALPRHRPNPIPA